MVASAFLVESINTTYLGFAKGSRCALAYTVQHLNNNDHFWFLLPVTLWAITNL